MQGEHPGLVALAFWLKRERVLVGLGLALVSGLCWAWIVAMALDMHGPMDGASAWMMTPDWTGHQLLLLWAMWAVMMAAMMLPSAAPLLLLYSRAAASRSDDPRRTTRVLALGAGYLTVWASFSVSATVLQRELAARMLLSPMMEPAATLVAPTLLILAGAYQLTPLKRACLSACRSPLSFLMQSWRTGVSGAFRMGAEHGLYCLGCCWALMLLLFAGGVMNLLVIAALTAWVAVEKLLPLGERAARIAGVLLVAAGLWTLLR
ncbi:MAG TPA: DUF2182 domain-containing protein [Gammaproteobacteria bacterium]|nr:DUF2182 domain-containing protein [Gammaproteobacteria bacterium]